MNRKSDGTLLFFVLATVSIVLLILSSTGQLAAVEGFFGRITKPLLVPASGIGRQFSNVIITVRDLSTLRARNNQLQSQVDTLIIDNLRLTEVETENQRFRELLDFRQHNPSYDFRGGQVIARVISQGASNYLKTISIDLGADHGIEAGMPVVTERGLVGRIHTLGATTSTVLLITDPSSGVQALVERSRVAGIVTGRAGDSPSLEYIPQGFDLSPGDLIITSGFGGRFPKNLIIGQLVDVQQRDFEMFQSATLRPTVNFDLLEFVLVITSFRPLLGQPEEIESVG